MLEEHLMACRAKLMRELEPTSRRRRQVRQHPRHLPPRRRIHPLAKLPTCREFCFAIHYPIPDGWMNLNFDDSKWPNAFEYLDQEVGIIGVPGYWRYPDAFMGARWIWTVSLVFDNTVLLRKTVR